MTSQKPGLVFFILDVFAEEKLAGNQLAVFRVPPEFPAPLMQRIAREMNFSETTFIVSERERDGGWDVRIFTPEEELPFAGHPTLGTAFVIQLLGGVASRVCLNLGCGQIPVTFDGPGGDGALGWMHQLPPEFGPVIPAGPVAAALGLEEADLDERFPVQQVSTGIPFLIAPLHGLDALRRIRTTPDRVRQVMTNCASTGILVFCPEPHVAGRDLSVRAFTGYDTIPEDPATGSANGCLAGYLVRHRYFGRHIIDCQVEQGYEIGRPSLLRLRASNGEGRIDVHVGGKVFLVAKGEMFVDG